MHDHSHAHDHEHAHAHAHDRISAGPAAASDASLLRLSAIARVGGGAVIVGLLWLCVFWAMR